MIVSGEQWMELHGQTNAGRSLWITVVFRQEIILEREKCGSLMRRIKAVLNQQI